MKTADIARAEWSYVGQDVLKTAAYWIGRYCGLYSRRYDADLTADAIAIAYGRYVKWRETHKPEDEYKVISSFLRTAAREVIVGISRGKADQTETLAPEHDRAEAPGNVLRLIRVINRLPEQLQPIATAIVTSVGGLPTQRQLADMTGYNAGTICRQLSSLRAHPAMVDLQLTHVVETAACGL